MPQGALRTVAAGFVSALVLNLAAAAAALLVADHWNARGGEEASVTIIVVSAAFTALVGIAAAVKRGSRGLGLGVLLAAAFAPFLDIFLFFAYTLGVEGQSLS